MLETPIPSSGPQPISAVSGPAPLQPHCLFDKHTWWNLDGSGVQPPTFPPPTIQLAECQENTATTDQRHFSRPWLPGAALQCFPCTLLSMCPFKPPTFIVFFLYRILSEPEQDALSSVQSPSGAFFVGDRGRAVPFDHQVNGTALT